MPGGEEEEMKREILNPGTVVPIYGTVGAVLFTGGERYYMLIKNKNEVSLMPASLIEKLVDEENIPESWKDENNPRKT
jgi:hypothetical protein